MFCGWMTRPAAPLIALRRSRPIHLGGAAAKENHGAAERVHPPTEPTRPE